MFDPWIGLFYVQANWYASAAPIYVSVTESKRD